MRALIMMMLFAIAGCVAPSPSTQASADAPPVASQAPTPQPSTTREPLPVATPQKPRIGQPVKMPPMSDPLPPERVQVPSPVRVVRSCRVDSDCVVKNIGNCCGYYPACINKASPTDPAGVKAQCTQGGMASACGFPTIEGCRCANGQCIAGVAALDPSQDPPASDPVR
uniref:Secreted protein n=1 Tax=uncultured bacterium Lac36W TaxID=1403001 RepID=A0A059QCP0_9BACT|nr:hypothetical protein [uncultured bacterium Lac36W]